MCSNVNNHSITTIENVTSDIKKPVSDINWDEYFMAMIFLELKKNSEKCVTDAAIILNRRKFFVSMACGTNVDSDAEGHAEREALKKVLSGHEMYTTSFPCEDCARSLIEAGITKIIYYNHPVNCEKSKALFDKHHVTYRQFDSEIKEIILDYSYFCDNNKNDN